MPASETDSLRKEVADLRQQLQQLAGLPQQVHRLEKRIEELEEQLAKALEENRKFNHTLEVLSKGVTTLVLAVKGDSDYHIKGLVDNMATLTQNLQEMKATVNGIVTIKDKVLMGIGIFTAVGTPLLVVALKNMDVIMKMLSK